MREILDLTIDLHSFLNDAETKPIKESVEFLALADTGSCLRRLLAKEPADEWETSRKVLALYEDFLKGYKGPIIEADDSLERTLERGLEELREFSKLPVNHPMKTLDEGLSLLVVLDLVLVVAMEGIRNGRFSREVLGGLVGRINKELPTIKLPREVVDVAASFATRQGPDPDFPETFFWKMFQRMVLS